MLKRITIINLILLLTVVNLAKNERLIKKAKSITKQKQECSFSIIKIIFIDDMMKKLKKPKTGDIVKAIKANKEQQAICPTLEYSCCTLEQLNIQKNKVIQTRQTHEEIIKGARALQSEVERSGITKEQFPPEIQKKIKEKCPNIIAFHFELANIDKIYNTKVDIVSILQDTYDELEKITSGLRCQLCSSKFTKTLSLETSNEIPFLLFNFDNFKALVQANLRVEEVFTKLNFIYNVFAAKACLKGYDLDNFKMASVSNLLFFF